MQRLHQLQTHLHITPISYMDFQSLIPLAQQVVVRKVQAWCQEYIHNKITEYIEQAKFPEYLVNSLKELDIMKYFIDKPYGEEMSVLGQGMILATIAKYDTGVATFVMLQAPLVAYTILKMGSQEQKNLYLKDLISLNIIGGWGLTEDKIGSDATKIQTSVRIQGEQLILNGDKRWIGNGNRDILVVWSRNAQNKQVEGYIVNNKSKGVTSHKIQNKLGLRGVDNCVIKFDNVILNSNAKLPKATNFKNGVEKLLRHSRVTVCWITVGTCLGVYEHAISHATKRQQFSNSISSFQMIQQKITKMMGTIQAMLLICHRISFLQQNEKLSIGQVCMFKAWLTQRGRLVCMLGREVLGGNGITHDNYVIKALCDMEVLYTYEGSYDINILVGGRELTGVNGIK